jgi:AcrR family transcriptional regulator
MQVKKENIKELIVQVARQEFFDKGFKNSSMREISKKANVSLSNIYNYYKDKNELMKIIVTPLISTLTKILKDHNKPEYIDIDIFNSLEYQDVYINMFMNLVVNYKNELKLLIFNAHGSKYENFINDYCDRHEHIGYEYMKIMKRKYPQINVNISPFFIHTMSSWWLNNIGEMVSHNLKPKEIELFIKEYITFTTAGWKKLMEA